MTIWQQHSSFHNSFITALNTAPAFILSIPETIPSPLIFDNVSCVTCLHEKWGIYVKHVHSLFLSTSPSQTHYHLKTSKDILQDLLSLGSAAQVGADVLALLQVSIHSSVDLGSSLLLIKELQHERSATDSSNRVGDPLALDIRRAAVAGLTKSKSLANVGAGNETKRANKSSGTIRQDVAVEVRSNNNIIRLRLAEELVDHRVNNLLLNLDRAELGVGKGSLGGGAEEAVGL